MSTHKLYVGRLTPHVTEKDLTELFLKYGPIQEIKLMRGYAFLEFPYENAVDQASKELDGTLYFGSYIVVQRGLNGQSRGPPPPRVRTRPKSSKYRILIDGLNEDTDWKDLRDHFRFIGEICFTDVVTTVNGDKIKGIVEFATRESMSNAYIHMNQTKIKGSEITITIAEKKGKSPTRSEEEEENPIDRRRLTSRGKDESSRSLSPRPDDSVYMRNNKRESRSTDRSPSRGYSTSRSRSHSSGFERSERRKSRHRERDSSDSRSRSRSISRRKSRKRRSRSRNRRSRSRDRRNRSRDRRSRSRGRRSRSPDRKSKRKHHSREKSRSRRRKRSRSRSRNRSRSRERRTRSRERSRERKRYKSPRHRSKRRKSRSRDRHRRRSRSESDH